MSELREVNQSLDWFDLVLVFTTPCTSGAGAGLLSGGVVAGGVVAGGVVAGGVVSRLFWILERDLVILAASGADVVGWASAGLLPGSVALAVLATNPAATSDSVARTVSVRCIVLTPCKMANRNPTGATPGSPELHRTTTMPDDARH